MATATRGRGLILVLECQGQRVTLTESGKPYKFCSVDAIMVELDGAPNGNSARLSQFVRVA